MDLEEQRFDGEDNSSLTATKIGYVQQYLHVFHLHSKDRHVNSPYWSAVRISLPRRSFTDRRLICHI